LVLIDRRLKSQNRVTCETPQCRHEEERQQEGETAISTENRATRLIVSKAELNGWSTLSTEDWGCVEMETETSVFT
jgi:hypothetical protein